MLTYLIIRNFAIIDSLELEIPDGYSVITGETGAGKSIIINALNLVLGGRASTDVIRADTDRAVVEATFRLEGESKQRLDEALKAQGIETSEELFVRRVVYRQGRNKAFINGSLVGVSTLRRLTRGLVDISGQHEHYSLLAPDNHLGVLDRFGGLSERARRLSLEIKRMQELRRESRRLKNSERERLARMNYLEFQVREIENSVLDPNEKKELEDEQRLLRHAERLRDESSEILLTLYEGDQSVSDMVGDVCSSLQRLCDLDERLSGLLDILENARIQFSEVGVEMRQYTRNIEVNPQRLEEISEALHGHAELVRKYGDSYEDILSSLDEMRTELAGLQGKENRIEEAEKEANELSLTVMAEARMVSQERYTTAQRLKETIESELSFLGMARCRFRASIVHKDGKGNLLESVEETEVDALGEFGLDHVEFLLCPNPGEGFKPMARIASGGELSRIMLAIKNGLLATDPVSTLIFDEVDTGIGGITADAVGEKIKNISRTKQVLCITHLPQIAAYADQHLKVEKVQDVERTTSTIRLMSTTQRIQEVARMLGGRNCTETTLAHAREMISKSL